VHAFAHRRDCDIIKSESFAGLHYFKRFEKITFLAQRYLPIVYSKAYTQPPLE